MADPAMTATIPEEVVLTKTEIVSPRFTPRELRLIREHTGLSMSAILADEDGDDKFVVFGWLKLRRMGHPVDWAQMDDIVLSFDMSDAPADPTNGRQPTISPSSAATGA